MVIGRKALLSPAAPLAIAECPTEPSDEELLQRFAQDQDQGAFEALVLRHGPMVLGVCRRVPRQLSLCWSTKRDSWHDRISSPPGFTA
jgi:hypothetical protein